MPFKLFSVFTVQCGKIKIELADGPGKNREYHDNYFDGIDM